LEESSFREIKFRECEDSISRNEEKDKIIDSDTKFQCPVCFSTQNFATENSFSLHVEDCLSQQEINKILKEQPVEVQTSHKRKYKNDDEFIKKTKPVKNARIDSFFSRC